MAGSAHAHAAATHRYTHAGAADSNANPYADPQADFYTNP